MIRTSVKVAGTASQRSEWPIGMSKEMLITADPAKFFTGPHYNGFPAVLGRLAAVPVGRGQQARRFVGPDGRGQGEASR